MGLGNSQKNARMTVVFHGENLRYYDCGSAAPWTLEFNVREKDSRVTTLRSAHWAARTHG